VLVEIVSFEFQNIPLVVQRLTSWKVCCGSSNTEILGKRRELTCMDCCNFCCLCRFKFANSI